VDAPVLPLDAVIANDALERRPVRAADPAAEIRALESIRIALAGSPRGILQKLADNALALCAADSAGISLLEEAEGKRHFRWYATAGVIRELLWTTLPREASPCGAVLDRGAPLLMIAPQRHYTFIGQVKPPVSEVLLVPFSVRGSLVGTVWAVSHGAKQFDRDDRRMLGVLTAFAAAAYERLASMSPQDVIELSRMHRGMLTPDGKPQE